MLYKTAELEGALLDVAVAHAKGWEFWIAPDQSICMVGVKGHFDDPLLDGEVFAPSTDWAQGGPIIDKAKISVLSDNRHINGNWSGKTTNVARTDIVRQWGPTPLIAAMRAYVASKLGNEVEL